MTNSNAGTPGGEKQRSSRPRRRGRKRRGSGQENNAPQQQQQQQTEPRNQPPKEQQASGQGGQALRGEKGGRGRRRGNRRPPRTMEAASGEVLREQAKTAQPPQPMRKRTISEEVDGREPEFGCPMLTRTRLGLPFRGNQQVPRCSMGWAVHDEDEVLFCMHTPARELCWKENPEQLELLIEKLRPQIEAELAEKNSAAD